jgi:mannitol-1-/sugar-/sorbitol-6-/2-deoxyglucose-6-phosphatase
MDGLLIDSEPLWHRIEQRVFGDLGFRLGTAECEQTTGLRVDEVVRHWYDQQPWSEPGRDEIAARIVEEVVQLVLAEGEPKPGVHQAIEAARESNLRLAIASSSSRQLIDATLERLGLLDTFELVHSALDESHGKPHPAVYITTADRLGVDPRDCVAFEDSINGVIAAKAARMKCVAVPDLPRDRWAPFAVADAVLESLELVTPKLLTSLGG